MQSIITAVTPIPPFYAIRRATRSGAIYASTSTIW